MQLKSGAVLQGGKYQIKQGSGREGICGTYLSTHVSLKEAAVIKTLNPALVDHPEFPQLKAQFVKETRLLACSQHPHIVRVLDFFEENNLPFIVLQYVPGSTLADRVKAEGALTEAEAVHYIKQIGAALQVAHGVGLSHHNIRPQTIVAQQNTHSAVLVGFRFQHACLVNHPLLPGKTLFTPPAEILAVDNPHAGDLYSLAVTFFFLLLGQTPQKNFSLSQAPWSNETKQAIMRGVSRDPALRPKTMADWLKLLPSNQLGSAGLSPDRESPSPATATPTPPREPPAPIAQPTSIKPVSVKPVSVKPISPPSQELPARPKTAVDRVVDPRVITEAPTKIPTHPVPVNQSAPVATPIAKGAIEKKSSEQRSNTNGKTAATKPVAGKPQSPLSAKPPSAPPRSQRAGISPDDPTLVMSRPPAKPRRQRLMESAFDLQEHLPKIFLFTIAGAAAMGIGFGTALRLNAAKSPGSSIFHPTQPFAEKKWDGSLPVNTLPAPASPNQSSVISPDRSATLPLNGSFTLPNATLPNATLQKSTATGLVETPAGMRRRSPFKTTSPLLGEAIPNSALRRRSLEVPLVDRVTTSPASSKRPQPNPTTLPVLPDSAPLPETSAIPDSTLQTTVLPAARTPVLPQERYPVGASTLTPGGAPPRDILLPAEAQRKRDR